MELYHLSDDPEEKHDLAMTQPEKAAELRAKLQAWRVKENAQLPTPNPNYDPGHPNDPPAKKQPAEQ